MQCGCSSLSDNEPKPEVCPQTLAKEINNAIIFKVGAQRLPGQALSLQVIYDLVAEHPNDVRAITCNRALHLQGRLALLCQNERPSQCKPDPPPHDRLLGTAVPKRYMIRDVNKGCAYALPHALKKRIARDAALLPPAVAELNVHLDRAMARITTSAAKT